MTAVMFFAGAWGYLQLLRLPVPPGQANALPAGGGSLLSNSTALLALAAVLVTAVLAGVLAAVPWFSPLASGLPGVLLLAWTTVYLVSVRRAVEFIPLRSHSFGAGWEALLFNGILGAVGAVMVFPLFIPSRWRRPGRAEPDAFADAVDDYLTDVPSYGRAVTREEQLPLVGTVVGGQPAGGRCPAGGHQPHHRRFPGAAQHRLLPHGHARYRRAAACHRLIPRRPGHEPARSAVLPSARRVDTAG